MSLSLIITCEHGGNYVPEHYSHLFENHQETLKSHKGWDPGAWDLAKHISERTKAKAYGCFTTRLLVEANRSLHHPNLFSSFTTPLNEDEKSKLLNNIYFPYRTEVMDAIKKLKKPVLHLSIHTFTPILSGKMRKVDIGILFDPERGTEQTFSERLKSQLQNNPPDTVISFNEPYKGIDDGFATYLRTQYPDGQYLGIEIEVNQKFVGTESWSVIKDGFAESVRAVLDQ